MSQDIRSLLSDDQLQSLRAAYQPRVMDAIATQLVAAPYPPITTMVTFAAERFYNQAPPVLSPLDREKCLIGIFAAGRRPSFALAAHIYWGLMEGMTVEQCEEIVMLAALYGGLDIFVDATRVVSETLQRLAASADQGAEASSPRVILPALVAAFR